MISTEQLLAVCALKGHDMRPIATPLDSVYECTRCCAQINRYGSNARWFSVTAAFIDCGGQQYLRQYNIKEYQAFHALCNAPIDLGSKVL